MRLQRVDARVHMGTLRAELSPVTLLVGPTGSGKTTTIQAAVFAATGAAVGRGGIVRRPADVASRLAGDDGACVDAQFVATRDGEEDLVVQRQLCPNGDGGWSTPVTATGATGTQRRIASVVAERLGDVTTIDTPALLGASPKERGKALLSQCSASYRADDGFEPKARFDELAHEHEVEAAGVVGSECGKWAPGANVYDALRERIDFAARVVSSTRKEEKKKREAADHLAREAAEAQGFAGDMESVRRRFDTSASELRALAERRGAIRNASRRAGSIAAQIDDIDVRLARDPEQLRAELERVRLELEKAHAEHTRLTKNGEPRLPPETTDEIAGLRLGVEDARQRVDELDGQSRWLRSRRADVDSALDRLTADDGTAQCPTCGQAVGPDSDAARTLRARIDEIDARLAERKDDLEWASGDVDAWSAELRAAEVQQREAREAVIAARSDHRAHLDRLDSALGERGLPREIERIERALSERDALVRQRAELVADKVGVVVEDTDVLDAQISGLEQEQRELRDRLEAAAEAEQRRASHATAVAERDALREQLRIAQIAQSCWSRVTVEFGRDLVAPLVDTAARMLPQGWTLEVDLDRTLFHLGRPDRPLTRLEALANGEATMVFAAFAAARAYVAGLPWRVALVDHAEAVSNDGPDDGLFVAFVRNLGRLVDEGLLDQAIVAAGRVSRRELDAIREALGDVVGVVEFARSDSVDDSGAEDVDHDGGGDDGLTEVDQIGDGADGEESADHLTDDDAGGVIADDPADDSSGPLYRASDVRAIRDAVTRVSVTGLREFNQTELGRSADEPVAEIRAQVVRRLKSAGHEPAGALDLCRLYASEYPAPVRKPSSGKACVSPLRSSEDDAFGSEGAA